jgi:deazaflavin-dependent oxidoreductase (nitroreductase family)
MLGHPPPRGALRAALQAPRHLYRLRLGWLLGHRFLLLTHRGRHSGRVYQTVVEVVRYDPQTLESIVVSGWGERADWFRNVQATPALAVETGGRRYVPAQRFLAPDEVYQELQAYVRRHRWAAGITRRLFGLRFDGADPQPRVALLRGIAFRPIPSGRR